MSLFFKVLSVFCVKDLLSLCNSTNCVSVRFVFYSSVKKFDADKLNKSYIYLRDLFIFKNVKNM